MLILALPLLHCIVYLPFVLASFVKKIPPFFPFLLAPLLVTKYLSNIN